MNRFLYKMRFSYNRPQKFFILMNKINSIIINTLMPIYYMLIPLNKFEKKNINRKQYDVIVTLTTYPKRINSVKLCLESLLRQSVKPKKIILWLASDEFPNLDSIPKSIKEMSKYGLEIRICENIKSYKKIIYAAKEFKNSLLVTADDDFIYPEDWLIELINANKNYPNCLVCHRAHRILFDNKKLKQYGNWDWYSNGITGPSYYLHPLSGAGIIYPKNFFEEDFCKLDVISKCCPNTDDIWIKFYSIVKRYPVVKVRPISKSIVSIISTQRESLIAINKSEGNDKAIKKLQDYYKIDLYNEISLLDNNIN